ncbi:uncharacterized protein UTRI_02753_B [Ustilago trichophora]|uniref:Las1-domain-containing protein n=1 Tax=Ustilago trichophora TaxID=86804 RepID=A0A5C3E342_9BASI|nr:uncharacterized protein UTRI_02753_B [Ustilago trichophora]
MKPPKRSPFLYSRQDDLLEIYRHLYPDSPFLPSNTSSAMDRNKALSIVQLWINRSACPFAVETTALLVQSVILDEHMQQVAASTLTSAAPSLRYALEQMGGGAELGVRLNYSLALTRFVNSVVDSHQTGGFAQSIAAIAARIGLPLWFVEIRHAVTHEELPSIAVCRQAAHSALAWLHRHFWIPQLFDGPHALQFGGASGQSGSAIDIDSPDHVAGEGSSSTLAASSSQTILNDQEEQTRRIDRRKALSDLRLTLRSYRQLSKQVTRDRSLANTSKDQFRRLYKQFAVFVSKIRTLEPNFATQLIDNAGSFKKGKDEEIDVRGVMTMDPDDVDECTKSALSDLVNQLIQPGGMVPLSKSKRVSGSATAEEIVLPSEVASLWTPLLGYLRDTFGPIFGQLLTEELVDAVLHQQQTADSISEGPATQEFTGGTEEQDDPSSQTWKSSAFASPSYRKTAEAWIRYLLTTVPPSSQMTNSSNVRPPTALTTEVEVAELCLPMRSHSSADLLEFLCERNVELKHRIGPLVAVLRVERFVSQTTTSEEEVSQFTEGGEELEESGFEGSLEVMQKRLEKMDSMQWAQAAAQTESQQQQQESREVHTIAQAQGEKAGGAEGGKMPCGWSMAGKEWKPTPFGCLNGTIPNLLLDLEPRLISSM